MWHFFWIFSSLGLIIIIILQNPKAQAMGNQSQVFGGTRAAETIVSKITWVLTFLFFLFAIVICISEKC
nr:preprotein translocase SecG subunit [Cryptomonas sp. NIES-345]BDA98427.1 preprotein translocase SecG subunit [Cryptomonas sp. NIES-1327]